MALIAFLTYLYYVLFSQPVFIVSLLLLGVLIVVLVRTAKKPHPLKWLLLFLADTTFLATAIVLFNYFQTQNMQDSVFPAVVSSFLFAICWIAIIFVFLLNRKKND